eukprot:4225267-Prymnesium_polylepis.3
MAHGAQAGGGVGMSPGASDVLCMGREQSSLQQIFAPHMSPQEYETYYRMPFWQKCLQNMFYTFGLDAVTKAFGGGKSASGIGKSLNAMAKEEGFELRSTCIDPNAKTASKKQVEHLTAAFTALADENRCDIEDWHDCVPDMVPPPWNEVVSRPGAYGAYIRTDPNRWSGSKLFTCEPDSG